MNAHRSPSPGDPGPVILRAQHRRLKHLGEWTLARDFAIEASDSVVVVDLLLPRLSPGDIQIDLDIDHTTVKLLVPDGAQIDDAGLRRTGHGRLEDRTGTSSRHGRRILLRGEMRSSEVRIHRGGVALLSLLPGHLHELRRAHKDGRLESTMTSGGS